MSPCKLSFSFIIILISIFINTCISTFTITNNCPHTIWPGTLAGAGTPQLITTGFQLDSGQRVAIPNALGWSGRIWARTGCTFDVTGAGSCLTGDCGGRLECNGMGATPPASLFEITLGDEKDFYDVSIVDGYNLPLLVAPQGVHGGLCNVTGCVADINMGCPKELQVMGGNENEGGVIIGCKSACEAFGLDQYCCSGEFANPTTCRPSFYSGMFKRACPRAYSYAYDDGTSTFTCKASEYALVFCPNSGMRRVDDPPIRESVNEKIGAGLIVSSSTILLPFQFSIIALLALVCTVDMPHTSDGLDLAKWQNDRQRCNRCRREIR